MTQIFKNIDKQLLGLYFLLVLLGIFTIYSTTYDENYSSIFSLSKSYGKQIMWFGISSCIGIIILLLDREFIQKAIPIFYGFTVLLLVLVLLIGTERNGAKAWFGVGSFGIQPAEFSKISVSLMVALFIANTNTTLLKLQTRIWLSIIIFIPILLILKQPDLGTVLVFLGFILVLYREGIIGNILLYGLLLVVVSVVSLLLKDTINLFFGFPIHSHYTLIFTLILMAILVTLGVNVTTYQRYRKSKYD